MTNKPEINNPLRELRDHYGLTNHKVATLLNLKIGNVTHLMSRAPNKFSRDSYAARLELLINAVIGEWRRNYPTDNPISLHDCAVDLYYKIQPEHRLPIELNFIIKIILGL